MSVIFIFFVIFLSVFLEILSGSFGLIVPVSAMAVFYITAVYEWKIGMISALISGVAVDLLYGREIIFTPFFLMLAVVISIFWLYKGETKSLLIHFIPGGVCGALVSLPPLLIFSLGPDDGAAGFVRTIHIISQFMFSIVVSALWLPLFLLVVDTLSGWLGLEIYATVKERLAERS